MKSRKTYQSAEIKTGEQPKQVLSSVGQRDPELIEKFYKQIINSFGYGYPAKV
jgi:hypothetical protein